MAGTKIKKRQLEPLNITNADVAADAAIATSKLQAGFLIGTIPQKADKTYVDAAVLTLTEDIQDVEDALGGKENAFSKGNILPGIGIDLTGIGTGRLVGSGDLTVSVSSIDASKVSTGVFTIDRIPTIPAEKITTGVLDDARIPTLSISKISGLQTALNSKEPVFSKNTAFNKNFGTTAGTVAEGNHTHPASDIVSGTLDVARIPNLPASRITSGTLSASRIPALPYLPTNGGSVNGLVYIIPDQGAASGANRIAFANNGGSASTGTYIGAWNHNGDTAYYLRCYEVSGIQAEFYLGGVKATEFYRTSTREIKKNIKPFMDDALAIINSVDVVSYRLKKGGGHKKIGFIAEDTHEYLSTPDHNVMDTGSSVGLLIKAVQELSSKVNELERRLSCHE